MKFISKIWYVLFNMNFNAYGSCWPPHPKIENQELRHQVWKSELEVRGYKRVEVIEKNAFGCVVILILIRKGKIGWAIISFLIRKVKFGCAIISILIRKGKFRYTSPLLRVCSNTICRFLEEHIFKDWKLQFLFLEDQHQLI